MVKQLEMYQQQGIENWTHTFLYPIHVVKQLEMYQQQDIENWIHNFLHTLFEIYISTFLIATKGYSKLDINLSIPCYCGKRV